MNTNGKIHHDIRLCIVLVQSGEIHGGKSLGCELDPQSFPYQYILSKLLLYIKENMTRLSVNIKIDR